MAELDEDFLRGVCAARWSFLAEGGERSLDLGFPRGADRARDLVPLTIENERGGRGEDADLTDQCQLMFGIYIYMSYPGSRRSNFTKDYARCSAGGTEGRRELNERGALAERTDLRWVKAESALALAP